MKKMKKLFPFLVVPLLLTSCAPFSKVAYDDQFGHYLSIRKLADEVVAKNLITKEDNILLIPIAKPETKKSPDVFEDAIISGLCAKGMRVKRTTEHPSAHAQGKSILGDETEAMLDVKGLSKQGITKVLAYRWLKSFDVSYEEYAKQPNYPHFNDEISPDDSAKKMPIDRAYLRVIDTTTGDIAWSDLLTVSANGPIPCSMQFDLEQLLK